MCEGLQHSGLQQLDALPLSSRNGVRRRAPRVSKGMELTADPEAVGQFAETVTEGLRARGSLAHDRRKVTRLTHIPGPHLSRFRQGKTRTPTQEGEVS